MIEFTDPTTGRTYTASEDDPAALNEIISKLMARVADLEAEIKTTKEGKNLALASGRDLQSQLDAERKKHETSTR